MLTIIVVVFLILSWIYEINCRKYVVLENCCFPVYGKCQEICKRSYIISERACVGCVGELHTCTQLVRNVEKRPRSMQFSFKQLIIIFCYVLVMVRWKTIVSDLVYYILVHLSRIFVLSLNNLDYF